MSNVNKVILVGNLGADPEMRSTQGGQTVCNFRVATSEAWKDRNDERQERTEWHHVTVWGKQAESCAQYLAKGRTVYVDGRLQSREYDDKEGVKRKVWEVIADKVVFLGGGDRGGADSQPHTDDRKGYTAPRQPRAEATRRPAGGSRPIAEPPAGGGFDDDPIPF